MSALRLAQLPEDTRYQAWYPPTQDKGRLEEKLLLGTYGVTIAPIHRTTESRSLLGNTYTRSCITFCFSCDFPRLTVPAGRKPAQDLVASHKVAESWKERRWLELPHILPLIHTYRR